MGVVSFWLDLMSCKEEIPFPLHHAARSGDVDKVRALLRSGKYYVNCCTDDGWTPLHCAAYGGQLGVVRVLISEFKANVNSWEGRGQTPFEDAFSGNAEEVALALVTEFNCDTYGGGPYIRSACMNGWVRLVRVLLKKHGVGILKPNRYSVYDRSLLYSIAREDKHEVAIMLVEEFGSAVVTVDGRSLLHIACEKGNLGLTRALMNHNADVTARDNGGNTPLHVAVMNGHDDTVLVLINEFGCNVNEKGRNVQSPLHCACSEGRLSLIRALMNHNADVTARDNRGDTPLHVAVRNGHDDTVLVLIDGFGCNVNAKGQNGRSPLHCVCSMGRLNLV